MKIALVDDDENFAVLVAERLGGQVKYFSEVSLFQDDGFDAVLCDLSLRETFGVDTVKAILDKTAAPVIILTGIAGEKLEGTTSTAIIEMGVKEVFFKELVNDPEFPVKVLEIIANGKVG